MRITYLLLLVVAAFAACVPPEKKSERDMSRVSIDLKDKQVRAVYDFRDRRQSDSLFTRLKNPDASIRYLAAMAFASYHDSLAVTPLTPLLNDPVEEVRIAAALALGQIGSNAAEAPLTAAFVADDPRSEHQRLNAVILEAIGRCGSAANLKNLASISTYQPTDTLLLQGLCRAVYRYGQRKITDPAATARMVSYVSDEAIPAAARLMAAHYLARTEGITTDSLQTVRMAVAFVRAQEPEVRMALARALGKAGNGPAFGILSKVVKTETDWRVQCDIVNALAKYSYDTVRSLIIPKIADPNPHISRTAAEFFIANGRPKDADYYWRITRDYPALPWQSQVALFRASNRWLSGKDEPESKDYVNFRLREIFQQSQNPYERAACLHALSEFGWNYRVIHDKGAADPNLAVRTAAVEALATICKKDNFYAFFGEASKGVRRELYAYMREALGGKDPGAMAPAAEALRVKALDYRALRDTNRIRDIQEALAALKLPRDIETYYEVDKTLAYFEDRPESKPQPPAYNRPIDWNLLASPAGAPTTAVMKTSKGEIEFEFYPQWAPGTVAGFIERVRDKYYDGKKFHRVVPNFVVQGGCPRGDGYGSLDYSLRTEIGQVWYDGEGYVGMASAGLDTEGVQFFFTHSPTPHLDGRYTIFGRVTKGMDVVHQLLVGDGIEKVELK